MQSKYHAFYNYIDDTRPLAAISRPQTPPFICVTGEFRYIPSKSEQLPLAGRLSEAVINNTIEPEITNDVDGALAFDLRLRSGLLMFAELQTDGSLCVTILDDRGEETSVVDHLPSATEPQFMDRL